MMGDMRKIAKRDLRLGYGRHYYTAAQYFEALGQLDQVCHELGVDYGRCRSLLDTARARKRHG